MTCEMLAPVISLLACLCSMSMYLADETSPALQSDTSTDLRDILNRMKKLENDDVEQRERLQEVRNVVNNQNARLLYQNRMIKAYTRRVISLERQLTSIRNAAAQPKKVPKETDTMDNPDSVHVKPINERIRQVRAVSGEPVAFFAEFHGSGQVNIGQNQIIVFPNVLTNLGNAYHNNHGVFIAPRGGVYFFSVSILAPWDGYIDFNIMINGRRVASAIAAGNNRSHRTQGSVTVVSQLAVGDEAWVSLRDPVGTSLVGSDFSSFAGCLVTPI